MRDISQAGNEEWIFRASWSPVTVFTLEAISPAPVDLKDGGGDAVHMLGALVGPTGTEPEPALGSTLIEPPLLYEGVEGAFKDHNGLRHPLAVSTLFLPELGTSLLCDLLIITSWTRGGGGAPGRICRGLMTCAEMSLDRAESIDDFEVACSLASMMTWRGLLILLTDVGDRTAVA